MQSDNKTHIDTAQRSRYHDNKMEMAHFVATVVEREGGRKERETDRQRENEGGRWQQRDPVFNSGGETGHF